MFSEDELFKNFYNQMLTALEYRRSIPQFSLKELENELEALYIYQGQDWEGRGVIKDVEIEAQIAAYQVTLHQWKKEASEDK